MSLTKGWSGQNPWPTLFLSKISSMARKSKENIDQEIDNIDMTVSINNTDYITNSIKGKEISLNFKKESFFGVGKIWLSSENHSCVVPEEISSADETIIKKAINSGVLILGNSFVPNISRDENVPIEYWDLIKSYGIRPTEESKSFKKFKYLIKYGIDRNWTAKEIIKICIENEKQYKNRKDVIKYLESVFDTIQCPDTLLLQKKVN